VLLNDFVDEDGETGGRSANLKRTARKHSNDKATDDARNQSGGGRGARGDRNSHAEGKRYQENNDGSQEILPYSERIHRRSLCGKNLYLGWARLLDVDKPLQVIWSNL